VIAAAYELTPRGMFPPTDGSQELGAAPMTIPDRIARKDITMNVKELFVAVPGALFILGSGVATAGEPIKDTGAMACVTDKWDVKEPEKGHKLVEAAMRCVLIPDDPAEPTISQDCAGNYEYLPDESWKGAGTCTDNYPDGKINLTWEEGLTSRSTHTSKRAAPENTRESRAGGHTCTRVLATPFRGADTKGRYSYPEIPRLSMAASGVVSANL
jgi:hypothetical protein